MLAEPARPIQARRATRPQSPRDASPAAIGRAVDHGMLKGRQVVGGVSQCSWKRSTSNTLRPCTRTCTGLIWPVAGITRISISISPPVSYGLAPPKQSLDLDVGQYPPSTRLVALMTSGADHRRQGNAADRVGRSGRRPKPGSPAADDPRPAVWPASESRPRVPSSTLVRTVGKIGGRLRRLSFAPSRPHVEHRNLVNSPSCFPDASARFAPPMWI